MTITLIGMSNLGKTHWADRLVGECGFEKIDCDALVEAKLGPQLQQFGFSGIEDVAKWMGFPYDSQYPETSAEFVRSERQVMLDIIEQIKTNSSDIPIVIDTCGSVIYTGDDVLSELKKISTIIYLEASLEHRQQLFESYIAEPKPVVWGNDAYAPLDGEDSLTALKRCYPDLLEDRARQYAKIAEISIAFEKHRDSNASPTQLFPAS